MSVYGKIFAQIYDGSLYGHWQALVTFQQLIVLADKNGVVDMTPLALAARTSIPLEIIEQGIAQLEAPDPASRTPDEDGRRILRLSEHRTWGWQITNYDYYRRIRTAEERREYFKQHKRKARKRAKSPQSPPDVHSGPQLSTIVHHNPPAVYSGPQIPPIVEVEAEVLTTTTSRENPASDPNGTEKPPRTTWLSPICAVWENHGGGGSFATVAGQAAKALRPLVAHGHDPPEIADHLERYMVRTESRFWSVTRFAQTYAEWEPKPLVDDMGILTLAGIDVVR